MRLRRAGGIALIVFGWVAAHGAAAWAQPPRSSEPPAAEKVSPAQVKAAIDLLGSLEFPIRMNAGRTVRRAESTVAVPALLEAVASHKDSYVRFKAVVVLSGFNDPRTGDVMVKALDDRNDRLRAAAYGWFEHHPDPKTAAGGAEQRGIRVRQAVVDPGARRPRYRCEGP
jgi:HEAT repeat protein